MLTEKEKQTKREWYKKNRLRVLAAVRKYREKNKEKIALTHKRYQEKFREKIKARMKIYFVENKERLRKMNRDKYLELRDKVLKHYSNNATVGCVRCGFSDIRALQLDHIQENGNEDRLTNGHSRTLYKNLIKKRFPVGYQVLCANCNWIKEMDRRST